MDKNLSFSRPYLITLKIAYDHYLNLLYRAQLLPNARLHGEHFIARRIIRGGDRREVVRRSVQWFWKQFKGNIGNAHDVITINDPYDEVRYNKSFSCADPMNKYLDDETTNKVIQDSNGKLMRETRKGTPHHPPNSVKRVKRRRKYHQTVAPRISISSTGAYYYRLTLRSQISKQGEILQKRKIQNVRLQANTLEEAQIEVIKRGFHEPDSSISPNLLY